jgi:hypothetical protein
MAPNTNDLFNSHEMEERGSIYGPNHWFLKCFGYYASQIGIIQDFDDGLYIVEI